MAKKVPKVKIMQCECENLTLKGATHVKCYDANGKPLIEAATMLFKSRK